MTMPDTGTGAGCGTKSGASAPALAYVAAVVDDPAGVAAVFERDLGLPRAEVPAPGGAVPWIAVGDSAIALFGPGHESTGGAARSGVHHIAIAATDPAAVAAQCGFTCDAATPGLGGGHQVALAAPRHPRHRDPGCASRSARTRESARAITWSGSTTSGLRARTTGQPGRCLPGGSAVR